MKIENIVNEVLMAEKNIRAHVNTTEVLKSDYLSSLTGGEVYLKLENQQKTGSFKLRGAVNKVLSLSDEECEIGIITASTGNHGLAFATASGLRDHVKAQLFVPKTASQMKLNKIKALGNLEINEYGNDSSATEEYAKKFAEDNYMTWVSPYNDLKIIGGQGTVGVEIAEQLDSDLDAVLITIGGGGLISGTASYLKSVLPDVLIMGCVPANSPEVYWAIRDKKYVESMSLDTISDGSAGGYEKGAITLDIIEAVTDRYQEVSEDEIKEAMKLIYKHDQQIIEGAAGVSVASFIKNKELFKGKKVCIVICGGNINLELFESIVNN